MPTRPMNAGEDRKALHRVTAGRDGAVVDVKQRAGARKASGTFRVTNKATGVALEITEFGRLQTAGEWASFTGMARLRPAEPERSVTVILDAGELVVSSGDFTFSAGARR